MNEEQLSKFHDLYFEVIAKQLQKHQDKKPYIPDLNESLQCSICFQQFSSQQADPHFPLILNECGHTFCRACIYKFKRGGYFNERICPLDKIISRKSMTNYQLLSIIDSAQTSKEEYRPTCEQHQGNEIIFYETSKQKFICQNCLDDCNGKGSINSLQYISYVELKPKILERMKSRINAKFNKSPQLKEEIDRKYIDNERLSLINKIQAQKAEEIKRINEEANAKIIEIKAKFNEEATKEATQQLVQFNKQRMQAHNYQEGLCKTFMVKFHTFLDQGSKSKKNIKELNIQQILDILSKNEISNDKLAEQIAVQIVINRNKFL